jgi:hypothetical protein
MYYAVVATFMFAFPLLSIAIETAAGRPALGAALIGKWFVFWSVGIRLFTAGARQVIQPEYSANVILGLNNVESLLLVRELGFANLALGLVGMLSLLFPAWRLPVALSGGVFFGLAGVNHVLQAHRNQLENVAMVSDLFVAVILLTVFALPVWPRRLKAT